MTSAATGAPIRVLLAVGDRDLERLLLHALPEHGLAIAARCLDAPTLLERMREPGVDVALLSADLHGLIPATLAALRDRRRPAILLSDGHDPEHFAGLAHVLPATSSLDAIVAAVIEAEARGAIAPMLDATTTPSAIPIDPVTATESSVPASPRANPPPETLSTMRGRVIAVTSGKGGPGKTTIAIALAAGLGVRGERAVLIDADLRGGNIAPMLDLDPRRGLVGLSSASGALDALAAAELQDGPDCAVLAGVERPELAVALRDETVAAAVAALRNRAAWVVVDLAEAGTRPEDGVIRLADEVILVLGADLVAVWNARLALRSLQDAAGGTPISAVVNRREGNEHYDRDEIEQALGVPLLAVVQEDRAAARRAIAEQIPLSDTRGRAARDLRGLVAMVLDGRSTTSPAAAVSARLAMER